MNFCNKCNNKNEINANFCKFCGSQLSVVNQPKIKNGFVMSIVSLILFIISVFIITYCLCYDTTGFGIIISIFLFAPLVLISLILSIIAVVFYIKFTKKCKKIKNLRFIFNILNILQFIFIIIYIFNIFDIINTIQYLPIKEKLDSSYNNNYEIIERCRNANSSGTNEFATLIRLRKENRYSLFYYNDKNDLYLDLYNGLKFGDEFNLNNYFDDKYYSVAYINKNSEYPFSNVELGIIVERNYDDKEKLFNIVNNLYDEFVSFGYEGLSINFFITDKIDFEKSDKYNSFLISQMVDGCKNSFFKSLNDNLVFDYYYTGGIKFKNKYIYLNLYDNN